MKGAFYNELLQLRRNSFNPRTESRRVGLSVRAETKPKQPTGCHRIPPRERREASPAREVLGTEWRTPPMQRGAALSEKGEFFRERVKKKKKIHTPRDPEKTEAG